MFNNDATRHHVLAVASMPNPAARFLCALPTITLETDLIVFIVQRRKLRLRGMNGTLKLNHHPTWASCLGHFLLPVVWGAVLGVQVRWLDCLLLPLSQKQK